jgi:hypothetical protein
MEALDVFIFKRSEQALVAETFFAAVLLENACCIFGTVPELIV